MAEQAQPKNQNNPHNPLVKQLQLPLPSGPISHIFSFLSPEELARMAPVSTSFLSSSNEDDTSPEAKKISPEDRQVLSFAAERYEELTGLLMEKFKDLTQIQEIILLPEKQTTEIQRKLFRAVRGEILAGRISLSQAVEQVKIITQRSFTTLLESSLLLAKHFLKYLPAPSNMESTVNDLLADKALIDKKRDSNRTLGGETRIQQGLSIQQSQRATLTYRVQSDPQNLIRPFYDKNDTNKESLLRLILASGKGLEKNYYYFNPIRFVPGPKHWKSNWNVQLWHDNFIIAANSQLPESFRLQLLMNAAEHGHSRAVRHLVDSLRKAAKKEKSAVNPITTALQTALTMVQTQRAEVQKQFDTLYPVKSVPVTTTEGSSPASSVGQASQIDPEFANLANLLVSYDKIVLYLVKGGKKQLPYTPTIAGFYQRDLQAAAENPSKKDSKQSSAAKNRSGFSFGSLQHYAGSLFNRKQHEAQAPLLRPGSGSNNEAAERDLPPTGQGPEPAYSPSRSTASSAPR